MKTQSAQIKLVSCLILVLLACNACSSDDQEASVLKTGVWNGEDITFTVDDNPSEISNLEFTYSGHATGTICSYDYESGASFASLAGIENNSFEADLSTFHISGTFLTDSTAQIEIVWSEYDVACDATKSGEKVYLAGYNLTGKAAQP